MVIKYINYIFGTVNNFTSNYSIEHYDPPDKRKRPSIPLFPSLRTEFERTAPVIDEYINSKLSSTENIRKWINLFPSYYNRHSKLGIIDEVANKLQKEIRNLGYDDEDVYFHNYAHSHEGKEYRLKNVICNKAGNTSKTILICAHYDTVVYDKNGVDMVDVRAPGADDNASGVASILEMARILSTVPLNHSIQLVFFSGEEQGLGGSTYHAQEVKNSNIEIYRLINLDMIGSPTIPQTVMIDIDCSNEPLSCNEVLSNDKASQAFGRLMENMAYTYTPLQVKFDAVYASDYCPFEARGYVITGAYDGSGTPQNPHYRRTTDSPELLDIEFIASVTKLAN